MKITDAEIEELVETVDSWFYEMCGTKKIPFFMLLSIILGRLAVLSHTIGLTDEFKSLLAHSIASLTEKEEEGSKTLH